MSDFTHLKSERLVLRPFEGKDLPFFVAYRADPAVARYQSWSDYTMSDGEAFLREQSGLRFGVPNSWFQIAVALQTSDELIGDCVIHFLESRQQVEIGFTLARVYQGQGYAREALACLLGFLFETLQMHRVTAVTDVRNSHSVQLLERLGFRREGHYRQNVWFKGAWGDEYLYALLQEEWLAQGLEAKNKIVVENHKG